MKRSGSIHINNNKSGKKVLVICLAVSLVTASLCYYFLRESARKDISRMSSMYSVRTESVINSVFHKTDVLSVAVKLERGNVSRAYFNEVAKIVYKKNSGIRGIQYMPKGIVTYSYPVKGNEAVIGKNFLKIKDRRKDALLAINTKSIALSGPYHLIQGGLGVVARNPVFLKDKAGKEYFWGFSAIVLDLPDALESVGLDQLSASGYDYQLYSINENKERIIIAGDKHMDTGKAVCDVIKVPHHEWILAVREAHPWSDLLQSLLVLLFGILISLLIWRFYNTYQNEKSATAAKDIFFSNISHDMRTPLNAIIGFAGLVRDNDFTKEEVNDYLGKIQESGNLLNDLINDTLTMSKLSNGKMELNLMPLELHALFDSVVVLIRSAANEKRMHFDVDTSALPDSTVIADKLCVEKVLLNILSNAVKYTPEEGHIWYRVECMESAPGEIYIKTIIKDDGIGISREYIPHIFEPFSQENGSGYGTSGTGLGLSIVKHLVDIVNGSIDVQSEVGKGTTFTVDWYFKKTDDRPLCDMKTDVTTDESELAHKVLLAEDNQLNREFAVMLLNGKGIEVTEAENGESVFAEFAKSEAGTYDAILMDLRMPVMDGFEATRKIRALDREDAATIPIIAMSADAFADDIKKCMDAGMNDHIAKPVDPDLLFKMLHKDALEQYN